MTERIKKIQNGAKSLKWGCTRHSETETLFAVGHKSYHNVKYFVVSDDFSVSDANGVLPVLVKKCADEDEVIRTVFELLKQWFPPKGVNKSGDDKKVS